MTIRLDARFGKAISAALGVIMAFDAAYAASQWTVGLSSGSVGGQAQAASVQALTITAVASPAPGNLLYPGATGDVVASITNPNPFPVTITAVDLPTNTTYAAGYSDTSLTTAVAGCDASSSLVDWSQSAATSTSFPLTQALVVAPSGSADNPLVVTFTNAASMDPSSPASCEGLFFSMPAFTTITATGGAATATTGPVTDSY